MAAQRLRITILADNQAAPGLAGEHGLSCWVEAADRRVLLDTGTGGVLAANAEKLGIDLATADALVLSHGHRDHTGGLPQVLARAPGLHVYHHPGVVLERYSVTSDASRANGMPPEARAALEAVPDQRRHLVEQPTLLADGLGLTGPVPRETAYEDPGGPFFLDSAGQRPDPILDDLALWIATPRGAVVCLGCGHAGLVNTLRQILRTAGVSRIRAVLGGFHLIQAGAARLAATVDALAALDPDLVVPCHCTGDAATALFAERLGDRVSPGRAGATFHF
ncbi:MAG: MBL fold metallo-hydrolase [Candidatus Krumholzibacteriia bacterium]